MSYIFRLTFDNQELKVKNDPVGWDESKFTLKRSDADGDGVFKEFNLDLKWIKEGAEFIRSAYEQDGIQANVELKVSIWDANNFEEVELFNGKLNMTEYMVDTHRGRLEVSLPAENESLETRFLMLRKKDVDISSNKDYQGNALPTISKSNIRLHSQDLSQDLYGEVVADKSGIGFNNIRIGASFFGDHHRDVEHTYYIPVSMDDWQKDTLTKHFTLGFGVTNNLDAIGEWINFDFDTIADVDLFTSMQVDFLVTATNNNGRVLCGVDGQLIQEFKLEYYYEHRNKENTILEQVLIGQNLNQGLCGQGVYGSHTDYIGGSAALLSLQDRSFKQGDKILTYLKVTTFAAYKRLLIPYDLTFQITVTLFKQSAFQQVVGITTAVETEDEGVMIYECLERLAQHYIGKNTAFKSDYYGRTDLGYASDGDGAMRVIMKGINLRGIGIDQIFEQGDQQISGKIFLQWTSFFKSLMAMEGVSFGFETDAATGEKIVRVERLEYFYDTSQLIELTSVTGLIKKVHKDGYFSTIKAGYNKWFGQKEKGSLQEYNSERQYFSGITELDTEKDAMSDLIAGAYAIESTRRLQIGSFSQDSEYDENIFIIQVIRATEGDTVDWLSESNQDLTSITNVVDPIGVYNIKLTPARILRRLGKILASNFVNLSTLDISGFLRFSSAKGNHFVTSQLSTETQIVDEDADINMSQFTPIWINELYEFEYPLTLAELKTIKQSPLKIIKFTDNNGNVFYGFILEIAMDMRSPGKSKSEFKLLRAYE